MTPTDTDARASVPYGIPYHGWRPYCLRCTTMARMDDDGPPDQWRWKCASCGAKHSLSRIMEDSR